MSWTLPTKGTISPPRFRNAFFFTLSKVSNFLNHSMYSTSRKIFIIKQVNNASLLVIDFGAKELYQAFGSPPKDKGNNFKK